MPRHGIANALSVFRFVMACTAAYYILRYSPGVEWLSATVFIAVAAFTDPIDGRVARGKTGKGSPHGKLLNEFATGFLCNVPVVALLYALWPLGFSNAWFSTWAALCVIFAIGTVIFILFRRGRHGRVAERAEVAQGWFTGLIVGLTGLFVFSLGWQGAGNEFDLRARFLIMLVVLAVGAVVAHLSGERRYSRPQERAAGFYDEK